MFCGNDKNTAEPCFSFSRYLCWILHLVKLGTVFVNEESYLYHNYCLLLQDKGHNYIFLTSSLDNSDFYIYGFKYSQYQ